MGYKILANRVHERGTKSELLMSQEAYETALPSGENQTSALSGVLNQQNSIEAG